MKLRNLDRPADPAAYSPERGPIAVALQWLDTLTNCPGWNPAQRAAARQALADARALMGTDVLTLAGRHFPNAEPARMVDKVMHYVGPYSREEAGERVAQAQGVEQ